MKEANSLPPPCRFFFSLLRVNLYSLQTLLLFHNSLILHWFLSINVTNVLTGWVHLKFFWIYWIIFCSYHSASDINITCRDNVSFTSPNYPSPYPNRANENRLIRAPNGSRIVITFTDFNVEVDDFLDLVDNVDDQNFKRYTGEEMKFTPFLTKGNELHMTFISLESGRRRGFKASVSCYDYSGNCDFKQHCFETMQYIA